MIKVCVIGAAGRMGRRLVANIMEAADLELSGAVEAPGSPFLGRDAGLTAGVGESGIVISDDLEAALRKSNAVITFATGGVAAQTAAAVAAGCSVVIGTTALSAAEKAELVRLAGNGGRIVLAPNMSVGVNLLFHLVRRAASVLNDYDIEILEMHHNLKKDAPSGTAVRLAEVVCEELERHYEEDVVHGRSGVTGERTRREIGVHALRGGDVVGDHTVVFATGGERLELTHKASNRDTFAKGALRAVRFLSFAVPGLYDMQDVLGLK